MASTLESGPGNEQMLVPQHAFPCGCIAWTSPGGHHSLTWCPYHERTHGAVERPPAQPGNEALQPRV